MQIEVEANLLDENVNELGNELSRISMKQVNIDVENPGSEETPEAPNQTLCLNNRKFNPSLISFPVLTFLCVIFLILVPIYLWHIRTANDFENHILKGHIFYSSTIVLPTVYFILNPKHLTKATKLLFEGL